MSLGALCAFNVVLLSHSLLQNPQTSLFTIDRHSGVFRIKSGEKLDYEKAKTHFVTVIAKVMTGLNLNELVCRVFNFHFDPL